MSREDDGMLQGKKVGQLYRFEGSVLQVGAIARHDGTRKK